MLYLHDLNKNMKLPSFFHPSHSIAARLTWRVVGTLFLISMILSALVLAAIWIVGILIFGALYWSRMDVSEEKINTVFSAVEVALSNNVPELEESINNKDKEFYAIDHLLRLNPNIVGAAYALNPDYEPRKGQLVAPYVYRDSTGIKSKRLDNPEYDYIHKEWFAKPIEMGKTLWTEPYVDEGGGEILMTTCSMPLFNNKGEMYVVQTADLSLNWITKLTEEVDSLNNTDYYLGLRKKDKGHSRSFIVTANGNFVVHPDKKLQATERIENYFKSPKEKKAKNAIKEILSGENGITSFTDQDGNTNFMFYGPIKHTGWTMVTMVPFRDLLTPVNLFIRILIISLIIGLIIIALVCRRNIHNLTKPLRLFANSADEIAKGNFIAPLPKIKSKDEMLKLHNSFSTMQQSLISQIEEIKKANEEKGRIESELAIARNIQMSMIPKTFPAFPDRTDIDVFASLTPAKEVGGDLYDYLIRDEKLFFCIGDVSGKGIPASMVMAVTRALFRTATAHDSNPNKIMGGINEMLVDDNDSSMFVTLFVGVLDLPTGRLRYCNAGHNSPLLIDTTSTTILPCEANLPLGIMEKYKFAMQEAIISPQTTVFLYTDGLTEAENVRFELFKEERVIDVAKRTGPKPQELIEEMKRIVSRFVGNADQNDDMTMLAIQYTKQQLAYSRLSRSITLPNDIEQVPQLAAFVEEVCEEIELDMSTSMSINLAIEEAVVNVMSYAYPPGTEGNVTIEAMANEVQLKIIITDSGKPFDPTTKEKIDTTLPAEERMIGGLGIHLVREIMDSINYERTNGKNVLTLRKKLT